MKPCPAQRRRGFTLLEMLTVVGIIVLLIAILLPVVSKVQEQARRASTMSQISQIAGAIERYKTDNGGAYPGPLPNSYFKPVASVSGAGNITTTENLVIALCGGLEPNSNQSGYVEAGVGMGPMSQQPNAFRRKRTAPYIDPTPRQMAPDKPWGAPANNGKTGVSDTVIPEFIDRFQISKPILYMRANVGASGAVTDSSGQYNMSASYPPGATSYQYDLAWLTPYIDAVQQRPKPFSAADFPAGLAPAGAASYLAHPSIPNAPRNQNTYVLISAGPDGFFGTKDDIVYP